MESANLDNPNIPVEKKVISTHVMNVKELQNKDKPKYNPTNWYDKLSYLLMIGFGISLLFAGVSFLVDKLSSLIYLTPLFPIILASVWFVKKLFHGRDIETLK
jgi:hypothetical protein